MITGSLILALAHANDRIADLEAEIERLRDALEDIASVDRSYVEHHGEPLALDRIVARAKEALEADDG